MRSRNKEKREADRGKKADSQNTGKRATVFSKKKLSNGGSGGKAGRRNLTIRCREDEVIRRVDQSDKKPNLSNKRGGLKKKKGRGIFGRNPERAGRSGA